MALQADIEFNGTAASDEDLPINTLVQLSNNDLGDETTYLWELVSQPVGAADALSATNIKAPTLTPRKEGTYLLQLTVDATFPTEVVDRKIFRIRQLKSDDVMHLLAGLFAEPGMPDQIDRRRRRPFRTTGPFRPSRSKGYGRTWPRNRWHTD